MKKLFPISLSIILLSTSLFAQELQWSAKISLFKEQWLPAEPIIGTIEFTNNTGKALPFKWAGDFILDNDVACKQKDIPSITLPPRVSSSTQTKSNSNIKTETPGAVKIIEANLSRACSAQAEMLYSMGKHKLCLKLKTSNGYSSETCVSFEIIPPLGVDQEAYDLIKSRSKEPIKWVEQYSGKEQDSIRSAILSKYPTSTYAGYALCNGRPLSNDAINSLRDVEKLQPDSKKSREHAIYLIEHGPTVNKIKEYLRNGPDFAYSDVLRFTLSWKLALSGNCEESKAECEQVIALNRSPIEVERCKEFIDFLKQEGYLKK